MFWNPIIDTHPLFRAVEWNAPRRASLADPVAQPALDVYESEDELQVVATLPGLTAEAVELTLEDDELILSGAFPEPPEGLQPLLRESPSGSFRRVLRLPYAIDTERVRATFLDGRLAIRLPKAATARPFRIPVQARTQEVLDTPPSA